jgi:NADPH2:quinone reductase
VPPVNLGTLAAKGSLQITRPTLFTHIARHETCQEMARHLFAKVLSGSVRIRIDQRLPLAQVAEAHRALGARETTGASVLIP